MADQERASLRFKLLSMPDQLFTLPRNVSRLFFFLAGHPNDRQFARVAFQVTRQPLAQSRGIARIGLHPGVLFIEFTRRDDVAVRSGCL
jgi:hypothetical protein